MNNRLLATLTLAAVVLCAAALCAVAFAQAPRSTGHPLTCFPASQWGPASDGLRPCVRVTRLYEDGSFHFAVSDANGTVRYDAGVGALDR
jgi:hypothetical protein